MRTIPEATANLSENIAAGSLVYWPEEQRWGIRIEDGGVLWLASLQHGSPDGALADFGHDYTVSFTPESGIRVAYSWDDLPPSGLFFPSNHDADNVARATILMGRTQTMRLQATELESGAIRRFNSNSGFGVAFSDWRLGIENDDPERPIRWIHQVQRSAE